MREHTDAKPPDGVSTEDIRVTLCAKEESEKLIAQGPTTNIVENIKSEKTDTFTSEVRFKVQLTDVAFFATPRYKV